ncbi:cupredoxin domain-containing protein [Aneurinibacillus sp. Ricciae_BoGa-3]|uniref:cupredoxin domain-containing protein n=1 Tax=Aneurinibacillus sp. Ricciae_BoGa-3 TaxID=3022697 RepID=UPI00233F86E6|nr:cupredoxin domain-containing protein [Aneurinibacillus sp. Ricciae_BoGa-3]WCK55479.1 cupredoxin domain-containing protein [Aneurinibacillus sp. Ricciae_BoGa-3]
MKKTVVYSVLATICMAGTLTACSSQSTSAGNNSSTTSNPSASNQSAAGNQAAATNQGAANNQAAAAQKVVVSKGFPVILEEIKGGKLSDEKESIKAGSGIHFMLLNKDKSTYTFINKELRINNTIQPGQTVSFEWISPKKPGKYEVQLSEKGQKTSSSLALTLK